MLPMLENIQEYIQRPDAEGFWVECDGNSLTANKESNGTWTLQFEYWTNSKNTINVPADEVVSEVDKMVMGDKYAVYSLFEKPTCWTSSEIQSLMEKLQLKMCQQNFKGFTLSADGAETFTVTHTPFAFVEWRLNGKESSFYEVLRLTEEKLQENVYWTYSDM